jgi:hypothetical protein
MDTSFTIMDLAFFFPLMLSWVFDLCDVNIAEPQDGLGNSRGAGLYFSKRWRFSLFGTSLPPVIGLLWSVRAPPWPNTIATAIYQQIMDPDKEEFEEMEEMVR